MLLMIDNYDSFTYSLVRYVTELGHRVEVYRNDELSISDIEVLNPDHIIISPGPGRPDGAGISLACVRFFAGTVPILGVCLGYQAIAQAYGGRIVKAASVMHGKTSSIEHDGLNIFQGLSNPFVATRYHSLVVDPASLPSILKVTAWTQGANEHKEIMAIEHRELKLFGVQFHPESVLTDGGARLLSNFLSVCECRR